MPKIKRSNTKEPKGYAQNPSASTKKDPQNKPGYVSHGTLLNWLEFSKETSRQKRWEWFVIDQMLRGNHNVRGDPSDNSIVITKRTDSINYPINLIYANFRSVRAFVTRHKPQFEVEISEKTDQAKQYARRSNAVLKRDNQLNNARKLNKEWVYYGLKYGVGYRQIGYDVEKQCAIRWSVDPFDLFIGSKTGKFEDAPYVIKAVKRTVGYWKDKYPKANIVADSKLAEDEYKDLAERINQASSQGYSQENEQDTAIGYEAWYRLFEKNSMGGLVNKCLFFRNGIVTQEETPYTEYPFIPYECEILPNELYPDGVIKHQIAPQRMLNLLNTQMLEYNHITNRGRIIKDKNAGFKSIFAKEGHIIEKKPGAQVSVFNPPALNPALPEQMTRAERWQERIAGSTDASQGEAPFAGASGAAIEKLQQGDSNNISDYRDNFEDALALEAAWILKVYSLFENQGVVINDQYEETGEKKVDTFAAVGQNAKKPEGGKYYMEDNGGYCDICSILPDNHVKVSVGSELGETKEARMDLLVKLNEMGLPLSTVLKLIEFPNSDDVLQRISDEAIADMLMAQMQNPPVPPTGPSPEATQNGQATAEIANMNDQLSNV